MGKVGGDLFVKPQIICGGMVVFDKGFLVTCSDFCVVLVSLCNWGVQYGGVLYDFGQ